jgi:hypothetical protein
VDFCGLKNGLDYLLASMHGEVMQHIGEIGLMKKLLREAKASVVTPAKQKLLEAAAVIRLDPANAEAAFMARHLVQCTLPHSDPGNVPLWKRRNGNLTLSIVPGTDRDTGQSIGYPYGSIPRLLLFWIVTGIRARQKPTAGAGKQPGGVHVGHWTQPEYGRGKTRRRKTAPATDAAIVPRVDRL